ncbi:MAG: hypothetical protein Q8R92_08660 [Deltaproteobacteria bacterium]|nr:hypothetical protein [Deltaproteobacteria bacterium]
MSEDRTGTDPPRGTLSQKQLVVGLGSAGVIFAFILVAAFGQHLHFVKAYLIGPYGAYAAAWTILFLGILLYYASKETHRNDV